MAISMIRRQIALARAQDRKVKALAAARGRTEDEVVREAIDSLPDLDASVIEQLAAAGLLVPKTTDPTLPTGDELRNIEAKGYAWLDFLSEPIGLTQAVLDERYRR